MRLSRIALALGVALAGTLVSTPTATAGGWATTYLDPLPARMESGTTYVVGYWVLQHGSHPFEGDLGETRLRFDNGQGEQFAYQGTPLREPAHYAAAIVVPEEGTWRLSAVQGMFADYDIGTLTVPGGLALNPPPEPRNLPDDHQRIWGAVHPPELSPRLLSTPPAGPAQAASVQDLPNTNERDASWVVPTLSVLGLIGASLVLVLGRRRRARSSP